MRKLLLLLFFVVLANQSTAYSQNITLGKYRNTITIAVPTVNNLLIMLEMDTPTWEAQIKKAGYPEREMRNGGVEYKYWDAEPDGYGIVSISKKPRQITMSVLHDNPAKANFLDQIQAELEKYYVQAESGESQVYAFKKGNAKYRFDMHRNGVDEIIVATKQQ